MEGLISFMREIIGGPSEAEVSSAVLAKFLDGANQDLNVAVNHYLSSSRLPLMDLDDGQKPMAEVPTKFRTQTGT